MAEAKRNLGEAIGGKADEPFAGAPAVNVKYQTDAIGSGNGYREWEGGVELPLWLPGQRSAHRDEAEATLASADALTRAQRLEIAGEVRERYWQWAFARGNQQEAQLAHASAVDLERDIERRVAAGELPNTDLILAQQEVLSREDALHQAQDLASRAAQRFLQFTGLESLPQVEAEGPAEHPSIEPDHPALLAASAEAEQARAHRDRLVSERRANPSLWLGGKSSRDSSNGTYDSAVGVEITIPFGSMAHSAPAIAEGEAALTEALTSHDLARRDLQEALRGATQEYHSAEQSLARIARRLELADEALRLSRRAFELGETDLVRLLQARTEALLVHHQLETRRLEVGRAVARLNQVVGVLPQ